MGSDSIFQSMNKHEQGPLDPGDLPLKYFFNSKESVPFVLTVLCGITGHLTHLVTESLGLHPDTSLRKLKTTPLPPLSTSDSESLELCGLKRSSRC